MAAITAVHTLTAVALILGASEDLLHDLSIEMEPEDGCIAVYGPGEEYTPAFTAEGIERLRELIPKFSQLDPPIDTAALTGCVLTTARTHRLFRAKAFATWQETAGVPA